MTLLHNFIKSVKIRKRRKNMSEDQQIIQQQSAKPWWKRGRVLLFAASVVIIAAASVLIWWNLFRPYVSTNDARIATDILRVAPVGIGGQIEKVLVSEGDAVKKDQLLVEIDHRIAEANAEKATAKFHLSKLELERLRKLTKGNYSTERDYDNAKMNYQIADAEFKLAEVNLSNTYLKSPVDGLVIQIPAKVGNIIDPGQTAVMISDVGHAWVSANIEETKIARVRPGQSVHIDIDEGGSLNGTVSEVLETAASQFSLIPAENASGNFTKVVQKIPIKIKIDNYPSNRILKAGQSVTIRINTL
jgi:membrane fusion protein (multidrug efflux system)